MSLSLSEGLVQRFDRGARLSKTSRTPQGFLRAPANLSRVGVFVYERADGTKIRELRAPDDVFAEDSLASFASAPVTRDHPKAGMVNPDNAKDLSIGFTGETIEKRDAFVSGAVIITDASAIKDIEAGKLKEISLGYTCRIDATPGVHPQWGPYDQIQKNIVGNHVALGGSDWGRAGGEVGLRLDATSAISVDALCGIAVETRIDELSPKVDKVKHMETIIINGVEFEVPKAAAQAMRNEQTRQDAALKTLKADAEKLQGRFDAQSTEIAAVKAKLVEAEKPERFDSAVNARIDLVTKAKKVLGDVEIKGTKREIMELVLKKDSKDLDLTGKSDDYVEARFDSIVESAKSDTSAEAQAAAREAALKAAQGGGTRQDSKTARERMLERHANAWKEQAE